MNPEFKAYVSAVLEKQKQYPKTSQRRCICANNLRVIFEQEYEDRQMDCFDLLHSMVKAQIPAHVSFYFEAVIKDRFGHEPSQTDMQELRVRWLQSIIDNDVPTNISLIYETITKGV